MWPYLLGEWLGKQATGRETSSLGAFFSWFLEGLWISLLVGFVIDRVAANKRQRRRAEEERIRREAEQRRSALQARREQIQAAIGQLYELYRLIQALPHGLV